MTSTDSPSRSAHSVAQQDTSEASRPGSVRRVLAGLVAAGAIAFGGAGMLSPDEAAAAGVRVQTYAAQTYAGQTYEVQTYGVQGDDAELNRTSPASARGTR